MRGWPDKGPARTTVSRRLPGMGRAVLSMTYEALALSWRRGPLCVCTTLRGNRGRWSVIRRIRSPQGGGRLHLGHFGVTFDSPRNRLDHFAAHRCRSRPNRRLRSSCGWPCSSGLRYDLQNPAELLPRFSRWCWYTYRGSSPLNKGAIGGLSTSANRETCKNTVGEASSATRLSSAF